MVVMSIGSIANVVQTELDNIPSTISGAPLTRMCQGVRIYVEGYTGQTIGDTSIAEKYQPAIIDLAKAKVLARLNEEGSDASNISLGDFSITKGESSQLTASMNMFQKSGEEALRIIGRKQQYARIIGG
jgi:hypothetical protein